MSDNNLAEMLTEALQAREAWDEIPALYFVIRDDDNEGHFSLLQWDLGSELERDIWDSADPIAVLRGFAIAVASSSFLPRKLTPPPNACGVAFRTEGWAREVNLRKDSPAVIQEAIERARRHEIHSSPDRVECRIITMMTTEGRCFVVTMMRTGDIKVESSNSSDGVIQGQVPAALAMLTEAFRAKTN